MQSEQPENDSSDGESSEKDLFTSRYREIAPALYVWVSLRRRAALASYCEVDDLMQEIWCRAYAIRDRYQPDRSTFRAWIFRVAKNVLLEVVRKARKAGRVRTPEGHTSLVVAIRDVPDDVTSVSRRLARDDSIRAFVDNVAKMGDAERDLFLHIGLEERDYGDVATMLGIQREALKKRWQRLRKRLVESGLPEKLID